MKKKYVFLPIALSLLFAFSSCNTVKMVKDQSLASPKIVLSKGACFGDCPVYTLTIYNTGLMKFNGVRYTHMDGKYEKQLDEESYVRLITEFNEADLWQYEEMYNMDIADLPTTSFSFADEDKIKTIKGKTDIPYELVQLEDQLDSLTHLEGWVMTEAPPETAEDRAAIIDDEIIIKGNNSLILVRWLKKYKKYGLRIGKRLGPESDFWMVKFDKKLIEPWEMLKMIKDDPAIDEAEFNKKVSNRD